LVNRKYGAIIKLFKQKGEPIPLFLSKYSYGKLLISKIFCQVKGLSLPIKLGLNARESNFSDEMINFSKDKILFLLALSLSPFS